MECEGRGNLGCGSDVEVRVGPAAGERPWARSLRQMSRNFADARSFTLMSKGFIIYLIKSERSMEKGAEGGNRGDGWEE